MLFHAAYLARYTPTDKVEEDLVGLLASNMWQVMRNNSIEVALFDLEISGVDADIAGKFEQMDEYGRLALAFKKSARDNALELLRRYKSTSERAYHRAFQALEQVQRERKSASPLPAPNPCLDFLAVQTRLAPVPEPQTSGIDKEVTDSPAKHGVSDTSKPRKAGPFLISSANPQDQTAPTAVDDAQCESRS